MFDAHMQHLSVSNDSNGPAEVLLLL